LYIAGGLPELGKKTLIFKLCRFMEELRAENEVD